jgi:hypothetical protein
MKVWILSAHQGEYSDIITMTNIKVFANLESAEACKAKLDETGGLVRRFYELSREHAPRVPSGSLPPEEYAARHRTSMILDPECVSAFEAMNAALVAQGDEPLRSVTEYVSTGTEYSIEEHEVIGGE